MESFNINLLQNYFTGFENINHHYLNRYINFTLYYKYKNRNLNQNYELHHILPRSIFPEYERDKNNLIRLKPREHFIFHLILTRIFNNKNRELLCAFNTMNVTKNPRYNSTKNKWYEKERSEWRKIQGKYNKEYWKNNPDLNKIRNEKHSSTLRAASKEYWNEIIKKRNETLKGKSKEEKLRTNQLKREASNKYWEIIKNDPSKMEDIKKRRSYQAKNYWSNLPEERKKEIILKNSMSQKNKPLITCPHCGFQSNSIGNMKKYHFEKCLKNRNLTNEELQEILNTREKWRQKNSQSQKKIKNNP